MHFADPSLYNTTKVEYLYCHFKVFNHTQQSFFWQSTVSETFHIFVECFLMFKIMLIYAKILLPTEMSKLL